MMKKLLVCVLFFAGFSAQASHIVGGEFELLHVNGNQYRLNLIYYFDEINNTFNQPPQILEPTLSVVVFRKVDNMRMLSIVLTFSSKSIVGYTQPVCSNGEIVTSKLIYTTLLSLPDDQFGHPNGYYVVWERCCRNYTITNVRSQPPQSSAFFAGQTFYLEFPPVVKDGQPFINSSPRLFPPLNDYACPSRPYYVDFTGKDDDGDSLVYSMATPLNTHTGDAYPIIRSAPYPNVLWQPGYGINHIMNGEPDLAISTDGILSVKPKNQGLFVFAVKVEQFRDGQKIGENRRDFQMLVVDGCAPADPPVILGKKLTDPEFTYKDNMSVSFSNTVTDEERCIQVRISDPDSSKPEDNFFERVSLKVVGLNFKDESLNTILPEESTGILFNGSTKDFTICLPACPFIEGGAYQIGIIALDDACSIPLMDTLRVTVNVQPPANTSAYFTSPVTTAEVVNEGEVKEWFFEVRDDDLDNLTVFALPDGFLLEDAGMSVTILEQSPGLVKGKLQWEAYCDIYDFTARNFFQVKLIADDADLCDFSDPAEAVYKFNLWIPGNADPTIYSDLSPDPDKRKIIGLERRITESLSFKVFGQDTIDHDFLSLNWVNRDSFEGYSITFPAVEGTSQVQSQFDWQILCDEIDLEENDLFTFQFVVVDDLNQCRLYKADTLDVEVKILPPNNAKPSLIVKSLNDLQISNNSMLVILGQTIDLELKGLDADIPKDELSLELVEATGNVIPEGFDFVDTVGHSSLVATFIWTPTCAIFKDGIYENDYVFLFRLHDNKCYTEKEDLFELRVKVKDVEGSDTEFLPVNFFSPNNDGVNDYYSMEAVDLETGVVKNLLPLDNCINAFQSVTVYNRWGDAIFKSKDRSFRWYAENAAAGVYYYSIQFTKKEYKGSLTLHY